jgi:hypothetical protein
MGKKAKRIRFWLVWNENGHQPVYRHSTRASAEAEAARLSALNPDTAFLVLKPVGGRFTLPGKTLPVIITDAPEDDDGIPF